MRHRVLSRAHELRGSAGRAGHQRASTGHRLGDDQSERLRARARVHDDIKGSHRSVCTLDEPGETDAVGKTVRRCQPAQLDRGVLAAVGVVECATDDVGPDANRRGKRCHGPQKRVVTLPPAERRDQANSHGPLGGRRQPGERIQICHRSAWRKPLKIDSVVDDAKRRPFAGDRPHVRADALGIGNDEGTAIGVVADQPARQRALADVLVHVPQRCARIDARTRREHMCLEPVGMNDFRANRRQEITQLSFVTGQAERRAREHDPASGGSPAAQPGLTHPCQRSRHRQDADAHAEGRRAGAKRTRARNDEVQIPIRLEGPQFRGGLQQHRFGAAELIGHADECDPHQAGSRVPGAAAMTCGQSPSTAPGAYGSRRSAAARSPLAARRCASAECATVQTR